MPFATIGHVVVALFLLAMAGIQLNDPDPLFWIVLYLAVAVMPMARLGRRRWPVGWGVALGLVVAGLVVSLPGMIDFVKAGEFRLIGGGMSASRPHIESAREFLGALIGLVCLLPYGRWHTGRG
ncbi:MAG: transmembrane 220 family protein [Planctomycetota bacterium]